MTTQQKELRTMEERVIDLESKCAMLGGHIEWLINEVTILKRHTPKHTK